MESKQAACLSLFTQFVSLYTHASLIFHSLILFLTIFFSVPSFLHLSITLLLLFPFSSYPRSPHCPLLPLLFALCFSHSSVSRTFPFLFLLLAQSLLLASSFTSFCFSLCPLHPHSSTLLFALFFASLAFLRCSSFSPFSLQHIFLLLYLPLVSGAIL